MAKIVITCDTITEPDESTTRRLTKRQAEVVKQALIEFIQSDEFIDFTIDNGFEIFNYQIQIFGK